MALKLSAKQQAQLAFLALLPPRLQRINSVVEQMGGSSKLDESLVRGMIRVLDETKAGASQLGLGGLADAAGQMAAMARRGGGLQVKVRGLRDLLGGVRNHYDAALKKASVPEPGEVTEEEST
jgi:hypothetical protein